MSLIPIRKFGGMFTNPQGEDIPDFSSEWNINVDPQTQSQFRGVSNSGADFEVGGSLVDVPDATESRFIKYNASGTMKWDLVYLDKEDNDITIIEDFYNSAGNRTFTDKITSLNGNVSTIDVFGNTAQIGTGNGEGEQPYIVYRILNDKKFFNDNKTVTAGIFSHYGICDNQDVIFSVNNVTQTTPLEVNLKQVFGGSVVNHRLLKGDRIEIRGVGGATGANGIFTVSIKSDTLITLDGTSSGGSYTSGGTLYGNWCNINTLLLDAAAASGDYFAANILYAWGISIVYDGLQESNLLVNYDSTLNSTSNSATSSKCTVTLQVSAALAANSMFEDSLFDKRVTAVKIYRAESSDLVSENLGLYRLVETIDINKGLGETNWTSVGQFTYIDNGGYPEGGATYEEETGMLGTTERIFVHYDLNTTGGAYHWMAQPYVPKLSSAGGTPIPVDWDRYIFRSEKYRPNMVNWVEGNHLVLPEIPVDMLYHNDKLYAFTENWLYRINPELLIIEDSFPGAGVSVKGGVISTKYGMFGCNLNGAWQLKDNKIISITDNIKIGLGNYANDNWLKWAEDAISTPADLKRIIVGYLVDKECIIFMGQEPGAATTLAFVYYLPTTEWFMWDFGGKALDSTSGMVMGKDGELYWSGGTVMNQLLSGTGNEAAEWVSKEFTLNKPSQNKLWRKVIADSTASGGIITMKYATEGSDPVSGTTITSGNNINIYKKTFQVYVKTTSNATIDSLDILIRELIGDR